MELDGLGVRGVLRVLKQVDAVLAPDTAETWHPDVRFYRIERAGHLIGQFYLDMYARPSKQRAHTQATRKTQATRAT